MTATSGFDTRRLTRRAPGGPYRHLLTPGRIGQVELRNRIVLPAMDQNACTGDGLITDAVVAHYKERALGGAGLLILETSAVAYELTESPCRLLVTHSRRGCGEFS